jgi:hypothetical protein
MVMTIPPLVNGLKGDMEILAVRLLLLAPVDDDGTAAPGLGGETHGPLVPWAGAARPKGVALDLVDPLHRLPLVLALGEADVDRLGLRRRVELDDRRGVRPVPAPDRNRVRPVLVKIKSLISSSPSFFPSTSFELSLQAPLNA